MPCERRATGNGQRDSRGGLPEQTGVEGRPPTTATSVNRSPCANRVEGFMALSIRDREEGSTSLTALSWLVPSHIPVNAGLEGAPGKERWGFVWLPCADRAGRLAWGDSGPGSGFALPPQGLEGPHTQSLRDVSRPPCANRVRRYLRSETAYLMWVYQHHLWLPCSSRGWKADCVSHQHFKRNCPANAGLEETGESEFSIAARLPCECRAGRDLHVFLTDGKEFAL